MTSGASALFLTPEAQSDITDILNYTIDIWGEKQAEIYADLLYKGMSLLCESPYLGKERDDILPGYRIWRVEQHFAIYKVETGLISVIRVLHVNRDIVNRFS